jgi:cystathionine beta-lyase/cystathionine gamma-synthase
MCVDTVIRCISSIAMHLRMIVQHLKIPCFVLYCRIRTADVSHAVVAAIGHGVAIGAVFQSDPRITKVHYPGLPTNEDPQQYVIAQQQMPYGLFGGVLSIELATEAEAFVLAGAVTVTVLQRATSLGVSETLVEHRASIEPDSIRTSPAGLLRISVGLKDPKDLLADIRNVLRIMEDVCRPEAFE